MRINEALIKGAKGLKYERSMYRWRINDAGKVVSCNAIGAIAMGYGWVPKEDAELPNPEVIRFIYEKFPESKPEDINVFQMHDVGMRTERKVRKRSENLIWRICYLESWRDLSIDKLAKEIEKLLAMEVREVLV